MTHLQMNLYVDESGNTGETLTEGFKFNFADQPYYVAAGTLIHPAKMEMTKVFIEHLKKKFRVQAAELKASNIYEKKPKLIMELVDFIIDNEIPVFIELMDKVYYLNVQFVEHLITPGIPLSNDVIEMKNEMASNLGHFINSDIYHSFIQTCKTYTNESLEEFYKSLINHFDRTNEPKLKGMIEMTRNSYLKKKSIDPEKALKSSLPIPDLNSRNRPLHLLPNYNAFTNLIARVQFHKLRNGLDEIQIIHDEQKQFDIIFKAAFEAMKTSDTDTHTKDTIIQKKASFNIDSSLDLTFADSHSTPLVQLSDLLAGFVMRFWNDFKNDRAEKVDLYAPSIGKLTYPVEGSSIGINFVVPNNDHTRYSFLQGIY